MFSLHTIDSSVAEWKKILRKNFTRIGELADFLELTNEQRKKILFHPNFALQVPYRLAQKMAKGTLDDPIFKQFIPLQEELVKNPLFIQDPVSDLFFQKESKLLQKYEGRVLLMPTGACAMHCRYCFRQNFPYSTKKSMEEEIRKIAEDSSIQEVILSGGDPLSLSDESLDSLLSSLSSIPHIRRIRFHTRFPIGIPERIDESFLAVLRKVSQQIFFVIHCNHPRELDEDFFVRLKQLQLMGCIILNQAVLLRGVNDDEATLIELAKMLANHGILFYYLHQIDRVQGAAHFEVDEKKGAWLIDRIAQHLPGYAVPRYVKEIAGEPYKTML